MADTQILTAEQFAQLERLWNEGHLGPVAITTEGRAALVPLLPAILDEMRQRMRQEARRG